MSNKHKQSCKLNASSKCKRGRLFSLDCMFVTFGPPKHSMESNTKFQDFKCRNQHRLINLAASQPYLTLSYVLWIMDFNSLKDQVSNLTLYDLKAGVRKVQNGKLRPSGGHWAIFDFVKSSLFLYSGHELHGDGVEGIHRSWQSTSTTAGSDKGLDRFGKLRTTSRGGHRRR